MFPIRFSSQNSVNISLLSKTQTQFIITACISLLIAIIYSIPDGEKRFLPSPNSTYRICDPTRFLVNGYRALFPLRKCDLGMKMVVHILLVPMLRLSRIIEYVLYCMCLPGVHRDHFTA